MVNVLPDLSPETGGFDRTAPAHIRRYTYSRCPHRTSGSITPDTILIREAIEAELAVKGYTSVAAPAEADFVVAFTVGTRERIDATSYPVAYRGPWRWNWYAAETDLRVYREGTLSIDIFDGATKQPVWHGRARKAITSSDVSDPGPVIKQGVMSILKQFPSR